MIKRTLLIVLLGIGLTAPVGNEAFARVCVAKLGSTCVLWSGSLQCGIAATGLGSVTQDNISLACNGIATGQWAVVCGNPGSKDWTSPGVNLATFSGTINSQEYIITADNVDKSGNAYVEATAVPSPDLLAAITENGGCPNPNWSAIDALPCSLTLRDMQLTTNNCPPECPNKCVAADAFFECNLPSCATITWDVTYGFDTREYSCTKTGSNTYKNPVCIYY